MIKKFKKIVIKIGSSSIVNEKNKKIKIKWLNSICKDIKSIHPNQKFVIVCSGAIALGSKLVREKTLRRLEDKQAAAAIGQIELAKNWQQTLKKNKISAAQILLTLEDSEIRRRYLNVRKTINALHIKNIIPIITVEIISTLYKFLLLFLIFLERLFSTNNIKSIKTTKRTKLIISFLYIIS